MSLFDVMSVSASGMAAQRARAEILAENLANAETTRTPEGGPYRRKDVVFATAGHSSPFGPYWEQALEAPASPARSTPPSGTLARERASGVAGVEVAEVVVDDREPERRYIPGHPDADAQGYVAFPRVSPAEDMVDLMVASRGYQSNVSAMTAIKDMLHRSIDLLR